MRDPIRERKGDSRNQDKGLKPCGAGHNLVMYRGLDGFDIHYE